LILFRDIQFSLNGMLLATLSGALASGVGYVIWYAALRGLTTTRAAIVQLSVPVIAAWAGVVLLAETISTRLLLAGLLILGGIGLSVLGRGKN
jgi:drug/metabolite transporter (DMT)-like permease